MGMDMDISKMLGVLGEVAGERIRQVEVHERTPDHDDKHDRKEWAWFLGQRVHDLACPFDEAVLDPRRQLIEVAAIAVAAVEAIDRALLRTEFAPGYEARPVTSRHLALPPGHEIYSDPDLGDGGWFLIHPDEDTGCTVSGEWWDVRRTQIRLEPEKRYALTEITDAGDPVVREL